MLLDIRLFEKGGKLVRLRYVVRYSAFGREKGIKSG